jgi:hypothetical protein
MKCGKDQEDSLGANDVAGSECPSCGHVFSGPITIDSSIRDLIAAASNIGKTVGITVAHIKEFKDLEGIPEENLANDYGLFITVGGELMNHGLYYVSDDGEVSFLYGDQSK